MWVAFLVAFIMTTNGAQIGVQVAPQPFHTEAECLEMNAQVEKMIKEQPDIKGYSLKCVEVKESDVKVNGKDA